MEGLMKVAYLPRSLMYSIMGGRELSFWPEMAIDWARILYIWGQVRTMVLVPAMRIAVLLCIIMSVMLLLEKLLMGVVSLYAKVFRRRPKKLYKWEPVGGDEELGTAAYPMVLVQIPMYNEREVYHLSIKAACCLQWPSDRLIVQVLDDSTDPLIKILEVGKGKLMWFLSNKSTATLKEPAMSSNI